MKSFKLVVFITVSVISFNCKKKSEEVLPLIISKADFATHYKPGGTLFTNSNVSTLGSLTIPISGENQNWDVSGLSYTFANPINIAATAPSNSTFPSASFMVNTTTSFGVGSLSSGDVPKQEFYELSDAGYYHLGSATTATATINLPATIGGGTLTYAPQNIPYSTKFQQISFPLSMGSQWATNGIVTNSSFIANAAGVGVINTPGQARSTVDVTNIIMASGTINLKNIGSIRVLVNKQTISDRINYFLGGAPAPAALLTTLGLVDGAVTTTTVYEFYGEGFGRVGRIVLNSAGSGIASAFFRTN